MERRDEFAKACLAGLLADPGFAETYEETARIVFAQADAMIAEADKAKPAPPVELAIQALDEQIETLVRMADAIRREALIMLGSRNATSHAANRRRRNLLSAIATYETYRNDLKDKGLINS